MFVINSIFIIVGVFLTILGFLLYKYKMVEMLAGYDENKVTDKEGLAKWSGVNLILMGSTIVVVCLIGLILDFNTTILFILTVVASSIRMIIGSKELEKKVMIE